MNTTLEATKDYYEDQKKDILQQINFMKVKLRDVEREEQEVLSMYKNETPNWETIYA